MATLMLIAGCDRSGTPQRADAEMAPTNVANPASPVEAARRINTLRWNRNYHALGDMLTQKGRAPTIHFLKSIDRVMDAHKRLQAIAADRYGDQVHHAWNISSMENNLGIFSRDIDIVGQTLRGDRATVSLQAGDHVPLLRPTFVRMNGRWKLDSSITDDGICPSLDRFAARIDSVADQIRDGLSPVGYFNAVNDELFPGMIEIARGESIDPVRVTNAGETNEP